MITDIPDIAKFFIMVGLFITLLIIADIEKKRELKKTIDLLALETAIKNKILSIISEEDRFKKMENTAYAAFKEYYVWSIHDIMMDQIKQEGINYLKCTRIKLDLSFISDKIYAVLESPIISMKLSEYFYKDNIYTVEEAERIEQEAIEYNKTFGEEPEGEPELHPKESNSGDYTRYEDQYKSIEELSSTGTVEDLEEYE